MVIGDCPSGYMRKSGDIMGPGKVGQVFTATREECAAKCTIELRCLSFEHSHRTRLCNLNDNGVPDGPQYQDSAFFTKLGK